MEYIKIDNFLYIKNIKRKILIKITLIRIFLVKIVIVEILKTPTKILEI